MSKKFDVVNMSPRFDIDQYVHKMAYKDAFNRNKGKVKCLDCNGFLCTCQGILKDYGFETKIPIRELSMAQKIANCPQGCLNNTKKCVDCFKYNNFEMVMRI